MDNRRRQQKTSYQKKSWKRQKKNTTSIPHIDNSPHHFKSIISDKKASKIHGLIESSSSDSDSGQSDFDEEYYRNKPGPLQITEYNTVTVNGNPEDSEIECAGARIGQKTQSRNQSFENTGYLVDSDEWGARPHNDFVAIKPLQLDKINARTANSRNNSKKRRILKENVDLAAATPSQEISSYSTFAKRFKHKENEFNKPSLSKNFRPIVTPIHVTPIHTDIVSSLIVTNHNFQNFNNLDKLVANTSYTQIKNIHTFQVPVHTSIPSLPSVTNQNNFGSLQNANMSKINFKSEKKIISKENKDHHTQIQNIQTNKTGTVHKRIPNIPTAMNQNNIPNFKNDNTSKISSPVASTQNITGKSTKYKLTHPRAEESKNKNSTYSMHSNKIVSSVLPLAAHSSNNRGVVKSNTENIPATLCQNTRSNSRTNPYRSLKNTGSTQNIQNVPHNNTNTHIAEYLSSQRSEPVAMPRPNGTGSPTILMENEISCWKRLLYCILCTEP